MPLSKGGKYVANPKQGHFSEHEGAKPFQADGDEGKGGGGKHPHSIHIHHAGDGEPHPSNPHHVHIHHADGTHEHSDHASAQEAMDKAHSAMNGEEEQESPEFEAGEEEGQNEMASVRKSDNGAY